MGARLFTYLSDRPCKPCAAVPGLQNVIVAYRSQRLASADDPLARYNEVMDSTCGGKANVQELATCLNDFALGLSVVKYGNSFRGYGVSEGSTGIVSKGGSAESERLSWGRPDGLHPGATPF